jgi:hypothetical protein
LNLIRLNWSAGSGNLRREEDMLEHSPDSPPPLVAAPRHLRRRRMHTEIADALLVPGAEPVPLKESPAGAPAPEGRDAADTDAAGSDAAQHDAVDAVRAVQDKEAQQLAREKLNRRKRRVALVAVLFVAIALLAIVLALLLG